MPTSGAERVSRLVLDTSAYSHFRRGHAGVLDALARAERVLIPITVLGELEAAFESGARARDNRRGYAAARERCVDCRGYHRLRRNAPHLRPRLRPHPRHGSHVADAMIHLRESSPI